MFRFTWILPVLLIVLTSNAQIINLSGTVKNKAGQPIANALVTLVKQGITATTGADGAYKITGTGITTLPLLQPQNRTIIMDKGFLEFSLPIPSSVRVEIFDINGNLLQQEVLTSANTGFYRFNIEESIRASKICVVRASIGRDKVTFRYFSAGNGKYVVEQTTNSGTRVEEKRLTKVMAINDTLKTTASGYITNVKAITSYSQVLDIVMDSATGPAGRSAGCGKTTTLKGQSRLTIKVGEKDREYIIRLPDDYNSSTAYNLWFAIHPLGGTSEMIANARNYEYYGMWKFANPTGAKGTTIFCSPHGTPYSGSSLGWANSSGSDVEFIRTLIDKFKNELCIDTTRIFSEGFSMGGSMSYALACAMPSTFRAISMHSGGAMSGCSQSNRGPVAMFITHGTNDNVCKYPNSGPGQLKDLAQRNGCEAMDVPALLKPTDSSGKNPACASYSGCNTKYPCRACIFVGTHEYMPGGGAANTWVDDSTWSFFKQFF
ncbi:MAG TPA: hypothetical protein VHO70_13680 [Chitinispirillaceae bacterium]|nr:hypothetical protein [Chitinispirillaceae bacterium]